MPVRKPTVTNIAKVGRKVSRAGRNFVPRSAIFIIYAENGAFCLHVRTLMDIFSLVLCCCGGCVYYLYWLMFRLRGVCRPFVPIVHIDRVCRLLSPIFFVRIFYIGSLRAAGHAPIIFSTGRGIICCHKKLPAINVAGRVYSDTRRTSRCVWSPYRIDMCADRIDMYAGRVLNGTGEGCPPFYPVISSPCIQKRCAAVVTSLSASNELHMIVYIQMFFVQKNFRLPDCIHCRPNAMRSPLLVPCLYLSVALYVCLYRESLILFFISCRMPI